MDDCTPIMYQLSHLLSTPPPHTTSSIIWITQIHAIHTIATCTNGGMEQFSVALHRAKLLRFLKKLYTTGNCYWNGWYIILQKGVAVATGQTSSHITNPLPYLMWSSPSILTVFITPKNRFLQCTHCLVSNCFTAVRHKAQDDTTCACCYCTLNAQLLANQEGLLHL